MPSFTLSDVRVTQGKQDDLSLATGVDYCSKALATLGDVNLAPLLPSLHKLNLKQNQLSGKRALVGLRECTLLTWLNLQENQLGPDLDFGLGSQLSNLLGRKYKNI